MALSLCKRLKSAVAVSFALLLTVPIQAQAGGAAGSGEIVFAPIGAQAVPALGGTMLVILSILLAFIAFRVMRAKRAEGQVSAMAVSGMAIGVLAAAGAGGKLVSEAYSGVSAQQNVTGLEQLENGNYRFDLTSFAIVSGDITFTNDADSPVKVEALSWEPVDDQSVLKTGDEYCSEGDILQVGEECNVGAEDVGADGRS